VALIAVTRTLKFKTGGIKMTPLIEDLKSSHVEISDVFHQVAELGITSKKGQVMQSVILITKALISMKKAPWILSLGLCLFFGAASSSEGQSDTKNGTDNWEQIDTYEGIVLFRSIKETNDLLPFKAIGKLNIAYQRIVMALVDAEHKNNWAPKLKSTTVHNDISTNRFEYSEYYTTPWPFYDREFLLMGTVKYQKDRILFTAINSTNKHLADKGHLLANVKALEVAIIPLSPDRTQVEFTFLGDLGGWVPTFVKNIIQKKGPIRFIQAMQAHILNSKTLETHRYMALQKTELVIPPKP
jgi:hypothetical protein